MPVDSQAFIDQYKGQDIDGKPECLAVSTTAAKDTVEQDLTSIRILAIVEQVRDGSSIRVRLLLDDDSHQFINLVSSTGRAHRGVKAESTIFCQALAGVKSPKAMSGRDGETNAPSEEWGEEVCHID
jgi:hypothetical protein